MNVYPRLRAVTALALVGFGCGCISTRTERALDLAAGAPEARFAGSEAAPPLDEPSLRRALHVEDVERMALARSPRLRAAAHRIRAAALDARSAGSLPPPELMTELWQVPFARAYRIDQAQMWMVSLRQEIPAAGSLDAAAAAGGEEARAGIAMAASEARALVRDVDRAFADYAEATAAHASHLRHREIVGRMIDIARARYAATAPLADVTKAELERAELEEHIEHEHGRTQEAIARLNALLVRPVDAPLGPPESSEAETVGLSVREIATRYLAAHPDVEVNRRAAAAADAARRAADAEARVPKFAVAADVFLPVGGMPAGWGAEVSMSLPWLARGAARKAEAADHRAKAERSMADATLRNLEGNLGAALARVRASERRLRVLREQTAPAARRALDASQAAYATSGATVLDWLDSVRRSLDVDLALASSRAELDRALADLDLAAGARVPRTPLGSGEVHHG